MKFFPPDLIARTRSDDDAVADDASVEWDRQCKAYNQHLQAIRPRLSRGARRLLRNRHLHDAKVLTIAVDEVPRCSLFLQLDDPDTPAGKKFHELRYRLVGGPGRGLEWLRHKELAGDGKPLGMWLYDEMDVVEGNYNLMTHSILLTGGWEVRLTFVGVTSRRLDFLSLPTDEEGVTAVLLADDKPS